MRVSDSWAHDLVFSGVLLRGRLWHLGSPENTGQLRRRLSVEAPMGGDLIRGQEKAEKVPPSHERDNLVLLAEVLTCM